MKSGLRPGWSFPWASSFGGDFDVWFTEEEQHEGDFEYSYQREPVFEWREGQEAEARFAAMCRTDVPAVIRCGAHVKTIL